MSEIIIKAEGLGKKYIISHEKSETYTALRDVISRKAKGLVQRKEEILPAKEEFWALKDLSFEINKGEAVGIIGRNGAGKSTLLKVLSRITEPSTGRIGINGRVASLLEVGTGFHPELTGRENIFLNGAILGMSRAEIRRKFDEIVEFSGVEKFLDTPVKRYSSGMYVRLAFAVAAHLEPEILVVDEVLAVGDAEFQKKCLGKMKDVSSEDGRTVLFVSHNITAMQSLCTKGLLLDQGKLKFSGAINETISMYLRQFRDGNRKSEWNFENAPGNDIAKFMKAEVRSPDKVAQNGAFETGQPLEIEFVFYNLREGSTALDITFHLYDESGHLVFVGSTGQQFTETKRFGRGEIRAVCRIPENLMHEGNYSVQRVFLVQDRGIVNLDVKDVAQFEIIQKNEEQWGWMGAKEGIIKPKLEWVFQ
jgi:lipopolysaccharide transport system ATP-binding protein